MLPPVLCPMPDAASSGECVGNRHLSCILKHVTSTRPSSAASNRDIAEKGHGAEGLAHTSCRTVYAGQLVVANMEMQLHFPLTRTACWLRWRRRINLQCMARSLSLFAPISPPPRRCLPILLLIIVSFNLSVSNPRHCYSSRF